MYVDKRSLTQARVLTVDEVLWLHSQLKKDHVNAIDKALVAYILIALYGRCRHSDLQQVSDVIHDHDQDGGFIEIQTRVHKCARTVVLKTTLLPIVIPATGIDGTNWIPSAMEAFRSIGFEVEGQINGPLFRPPSSQPEIGLCERGLTSSEVTKFLRLCFGYSSDESANNGKVSSHSLKATTLAWASKFGLGPADRAVLGRHQSAYTETSAIYTRDASISAVGQLQGVINEIYAKRFFPDSARSMYFRHCNEDTVADTVGREPMLDVKVQEHAGDTEDWDLVEACVDLEKSEEVLWIESEDDVETSDSDGSNDDCSGPPEPKNRRFFVVQGLENCSFVKHKDPEFAGSSERKLLSCGRQRNANYVQAERFELVDMCKRCKSQALRNKAIWVKKRGWVKDFAVDQNISMAEQGLDAWHLSSRSSDRKAWSRFGPREDFAEIHVQAWNLSELGSDRWTPPSLLILIENVVFFTNFHNLVGSVEKWFK